MTWTGAGRHRELMTIPVVGAGEFIGKASESPVPSQSRDAPRRLCVLCGAATPTKSMPACWEHWQALPAPLQTYIIVAYGQGDVTHYAKGLTMAYEVWRARGFLPAASQRIAPVEPVDRRNVFDLAALLRDRKIPRLPTKTAKFRFAARSGTARAPSRPNRPARRSAN